MCLQLHLHWASLISTSLRGEEERGRARDSRRPLSPETQHIDGLNCLLSASMAKVTTPRPVSGVCNYIRKGKEGGRTMIDDNPLPAFSNGGRRSDAGGPPWGPEVEMRAFLKDTDAIRSPQTSRLLFISPLSASRFYIYLFLMLSCGWQRQQNRIQSVEEWFQAPAKRDFVART